MITVKVVCLCGTKFAFDADESVMLAEGVVSCPNCGADAASATNAQLLAARSATSSTAPQAPARVRLSVQRESAPPPETPPAGEEVGQVEPREETRPARPDFSRGRPLSKSELQIRRNRELARRRRPYVVLGVLAILAVVGFWGWYRFSGSKPGVVLNITYPRAERPLMARLLNEGELLLVRNREISVHSLPDNDLLWQKSYGSVTNFDDSEPLHLEINFHVERPGPDIRIRSNSFWVVWPDHVLHLEKDSGAPHRDLRLHRENPQEILMGEHALFLEHKASAPQKAAFEMFPYDGGDPRVFEFDRRPEDFTTEVVPDGLSLVVVKKHMLEEKTITRTISGPKVMTAAGVEKSADQNVDKILDENLTAGNSLGAATRIVQEWQRADDTPEEIVEDHSRYEVTLSRQGRDGSSTWTGEVTGNPVYFPLPGVDVVAGERDFHIVSKQGDGRWKGNLTYPLTSRARFAARFFQPDYYRRGNLGSFDDQNGLRYHFPFVEHDGRLYCHDRGVLAAYDLQSGAVQWRLTSVGIRKIMFDHQGRLYVATTSLSPEVLTKSALEPEGGRDVLMKIDPTDGSVLWSQEYLGTDIFMAGKYVYSQWLGVNDLDAAAMMAAGGKGSSISCAITRINPRSGDILWRLDYKGNPDVINTRGNSLLIQFARRLELVNFFSL